MLTFISRQRKRIEFIFYIINMETRKRFGNFSSDKRIKGLYVDSEIKKLEQTFLNNLISDICDYSNTYFGVIPKDIYNNYIRQHITPMFALYGSGVMNKDKLLAPCCPQVYSECYSYHGNGTTSNVYQTYYMIRCLNCGSAFIYKHNDKNSINMCLYIICMKKRDGSIIPIHSYFIPPSVLANMKGIYDCILFDNGKKKEIKFIVG